MQVVMSCGTENAFHTVEELEKCEYQITGTSPALCLPLDQVGEKAQVKGCPGDEL
jgi:protein kinase C substrate 80K-H